MSKLSNWLQVHAGVPKSVQQAATGVVRSVPGVGAVATAAESLRKVFDPFQGIVRPSNDPISVALGLGPGQGVLGSGSTGNGRVAPGEMGACPRGYHLNKHKLSDGTPARSVCVRNRSMNPMNGRAIARAARRIHKGEKLLRRIFSVQGKHHGTIKPKARKR